jgi:hypothetical protein
LIELLQGHRKCGQNDVTRDSGAGIKLLVFAFDTNCVIEELLVIDQLFFFICVLFNNSIVKNELAVV